MRKIKNLVIGGIENKIFNLILFTVLLICVALWAVTTYQGNMLSQLTEQTGERQREAIAAISDSVMEQVVEQSMGRTTRLEARIADELFKEREATEALRSQIKEYVDEASRARNEASELKRELFKLQNKR